MTELNEIDLEVLASPLSGATVGACDIALLTERARRNPRGRCRLLLHGDPSADLQEMLIVVVGQPYIRPHLNARSAKSFLVVDGAMEVVLFDASGGVYRHQRLERGRAAGTFLIRLSEPCYHTIIPVTETIVFVETSIGPHTCTIYAEWAPPVDGGAAACSYFAHLCAQVGVEL